MGLDTLPSELLEQVFSFVASELQVHRLRFLAACSTVSRSFHKAVAKFLYQDVSLYPSPVVRSQYREKATKQFRLLRTLARTPGLARNVRVFEEVRLRGHNEFLNTIAQDKIQTTVLSALDNLAGLRRLSLQHPSVMDHFLHTLPSRQPTLRELEIRNLDPTRCLWTIMAAPALVHLNALHWDIAISEYTPLLVQVCTLIDMLERTCPRLAVLSLSCIQGPFSSPADDEQSHDSLTPESFPVGDLDNGLSISHRTRSAITCTETCKLNMLRHLSLDGFTGILDWAIRFFGPALSRVTELELGITCLSIRKHLNFVRSMCSWAGPNLESLTLRTRTNPANDNRGAASHLRQLGQPLGTPPFSLRQTLKSLEVSRLAGLFSTDLGLELRRWTSLRHLALGDDLVRLGLNTDILTIHGLSTIDLQAYNTMHRFVQYLPHSLETLQLSLNGPHWSRNGLLLGGPGVFLHLPRLRLYHLRACQEIQGTNTFAVESELISTRRPHDFHPTNRNFKRINLAFILTGDESEHHQRHIVYREWETATMYDAPVGLVFSGEDSPVWSFDQKELDSIIYHCGADHAGLDESS